MDIKLIKTRHTSAIFAIVLIFGFLGSAHAKDAPKGAMVTKVYATPNCKPSAKAESITGALASLFLKPIVEAGINGIGAAFKKAGGDKVVTKSAQTPSHFYKITLGKNAVDETGLDLNIGCLTIVHGRLSVGDDIVQMAEEKQLSKKIASFPTGDEKIFLSPTKTAPANNTFSDDIRFFAEVKIKISDDKTAMHLVPNRLLIGKTIGGGRQKANRDIVLNVNFKLPSQNGGDSAFATAAMVFPKAKSDIFKNGGELEAQSSGWMPLAPLPASVASRITANAKRRLDRETFQEAITTLQDLIDNGGLSGQKLKDASAKKAAAVQSVKKLDKFIQNDESVLSLASPVTVTTTIVQTQEGNKFLLKVGTYLSENKESIAAPIVSAIDPKAKATAAATAADAEDTLRIAAINAVAIHDVEKAKVGADKNEVTIRVALITATQACRKLRAAGYDDIACLGI
jgi:hypothetical protein